jgi:hypothetical protein
MIYFSNIKLGITKNYVPSDLIQNELLLVEGRIMPLPLPRKMSMFLILASVNVLGYMAKGN